MIFMNSEHAQRWNEAVGTAGAIRDDGSINADFGASLYILTGITSAYSRIWPHIHCGYIDFELILNSGLSAGETILVALAGNLYNGGFFNRYTPEDIVNLCDVDSVSLAARALCLRKQRLNIDTIFSERFP